MCERHHGAQKNGVFHGPSRPHQVGRDDGLSMTRRERMDGAQAECHRQTQQHHAQPQVALIEQLRQEIAANHGTGRGCWRRGSGCHNRR